MQEYLFAHPDNNDATIRVRMDDEFVYLDFDLNFSSTAKLTRKMYDKIIRSEVQMLTFYPYLIKQITEAGGYAKSVDCVNPENSPITKMSICHLNKDDRNKLKWIFENMKELLVLSILEYSGVDK